jgi:hypothetical protein
VQGTLGDDGRAVLNRHEAERAVYIDFEGRQVGAPSLLGILHADSADPSRDVFEYRVLERLFWGAADARYLSTRSQLLADSSHNVEQLRCRLERAARGRGSPTRRMEQARAGRDPG